MAAVDSKYAWEIEYAREQQDIEDEMYLDGFWDDDDIANHLHRETEMIITWRRVYDAPGCLGEIVAGDGQSLLVQTDWDLPPIALVFGWSLKEVQTWGHPECKHLRTDGTTYCPDCPLEASDFIAAAAKWLANNDGVTADDPGYFISSTGTR